VIEPGAVADQPGTVLWTPPADARQTTEIGRYLTWLERERDRPFPGYNELWAWSVEDLEGFWGSIWDYFQIRAHAPYDRVLSDRAMPGGRWFAGAELNYAEHLLGTGDEDPDVSAIVAHSQTRDPIELTFGELRDQVARARAGLARLGVRPGDRVVAYMPNIPETLVAFAATASLGAVWASCAPELGTRSVVDRLAQLDPTVLLTVGGYGFRDRWIDCREKVREIRGRLSTLRHVVGLEYGDYGPRDALDWDELLAESAPLEFQPVAFDHPLYVLFSSGTTGPPKAIVHGHGGIVLEHLKSHALSWDLGPGDRLQWFTTTSWMMWNSLVSALLRRASAVMIDGDPTWPTLDWQWRLAGLTRPTCMGVSPTFVMASRNAGLQPGREHCLDSIRTFPLAGSPLPIAGYRYLNEQLPADALLLNGSGGTDVCTAIVGGTRIQPVYEGEISGPCLGVAAKSFDPGGNEIVNQLGELVITEPMPSMPVGFWNDPDGSRYRAAYFEHYPGVWRHGDWIRFTPWRTCQVTGRSDATLNRGGVRLGTGEFYGVLDEFPQIADSIVVHLEDDGGGPGQLLLFVVLADGAALDDELRSTIAKSLSRELSPRHVPDAVTPVPAIPRTLTGKKLEAPVKRVLVGALPEKVASLDALLDPTAFDAFVAFAASRRADPQHTMPAPEAR
jgi:acetoacetyl-CoA synthetase